MRLIEITGNPALTGFQAPKIIWLRNHESHHYERLAKVLLPKDYIRFLRDLFRTTENNLIGANELSISYDSLTAQAAQVHPGAEELIFLPYLTGERTPHLDPLASGAFIGLTTRHSAAHLVRAVLEGVTFSLRDGFEILHDLQLPIDQVRAIGGGGKSP